MNKLKPGDKVSIKMQGFENKVFEVTSEVIKSVFSRPVVLLKHIPGFFTIDSLEKIEQKIFWIGTNDEIFDFETQAETKEEAVKKYFKDAKNPIGEDNIIYVSEAQRIDIPFNLSWFMDHLIENDVLTDNELHEINIERFHESFKNLSGEALINLESEISQLITEKFNAAGVDTKALAMPTGKTYEYDITKDQFDDYVPF